MIGKSVRMSKLFKSNSERLVLVPLDHGVSLGAVKGLEKIHKTIEEINSTRADGVIIHKGVLRWCWRNGVQLKNT